MVRLVPLLAATVFLLTGAITLAVEDNGLSGTALLCAGLITLGAWIATEAYHSISEYRGQSPRAEGYKNKDAS